MCLLIAALLYFLNFNSLYSEYTWKLSYNDNIQNIDPMEKLEKLLITEEFYNKWDITCHLYKIQDIDYNEINRDEVCLILKNGWN